MTLAKKATQIARKGSFSRSSPCYNRHENEVQLPILHFTTMVTPGKMPWFFLFKVINTMAKFISYNMCHPSYQSSMNRMYLTDGKKVTASWIRRCNSASRDILFSHGFFYGTNKFLQNVTHIITSPKERSKEYLPAVDLIKYTQVFLVNDLIWVGLILECFHVIIKIKFSTLFNGKPDYLQQQVNDITVCSVEISVYRLGRRKEKYE